MSRIHSVSVFTHLAFDLDGWVFSHLQRAQTEKPDVDSERGEEKQPHGGGFHPVFFNHRRRWPSAEGRERQSTKHGERKIRRTTSMFGGLKHKKCSKPRVTPYGASSSDSVEPHLPRPTIRLRPPLSVKTKRTRIYRCMLLINTGTHLKTSPILQEELTTLPEVCLRHPLEFAHQCCSSWQDVPSTPQGPLRHYFWNQTKQNQ